MSFRRFKLLYNLYIDKFGLLNDVLNSKIRPNLRPFTTVATIYTLQVYIIVHSDKRQHIALCSRFR